MMKVISVFLFFAISIFLFLNFSSAEIEGHCVPAPGYPCDLPNDNSNPNSNANTGSAAYTTYITDYSGEVMIKDRNGNTKALKGQLSISEGITLITGKTGKVLVEFQDGSKMEIGPNSQFTVGDFKTESRLDFGKLKAKIKCIISTRRTSCYPTVTIGAVTSVRGTEYVAIADKTSNTTTIFVNEGTVSVTETKTNSAQDVSEGNSAVVDSSGMKIMPMSEAEWENASSEFDLESQSAISFLKQFAVYLSVLGVLLAAGLIYERTKKKRK